MNLLLFTILFVLFSSAYSLNYTISDCDQLQNIIPNNSSVYYILNNSFDCSALSFIPIPKFDGVLDGNGYTIYNLSITNNTNNCSLFRQGSGKVRNISFIDFKIQSSFSFIALIFGQCIGCGFEYITLNTSSPSMKNYVNGTGTSSSNTMGGIVAHVTNAFFKNIIIQNTIIQGECYSSSGGIAGAAYQSNFTNCHNLGFPSSPSTTIVHTSSYSGALVANMYEGMITNSGVSNGVMKNFGTAGAITGYAQSVQISNCYVKSSVTIITTSFDQIGSINGFYEFSSSVKQNFISNVYSRANITAPTGSKIGVLMGRVIFSNNASLSISNSYAAGFFSNVASSGAIIGSIENGNNCTFTSVFFDNTTTSVGIGSGNCQGGASLPTGLSCGDLYNTIMTFNQSTWNGNNLNSEMPQTYGGCTCQSGCQTNTPSTLTPSTLTPSTLTPSTLTPSTLVPSTLSPSTLVPSTLIPSTLTPSTLTPSTLTPSTADTTLIPSTLIPSTEVPSTLTPSTLTPSTLTPSIADNTLIPSTLIPSTEVPSTLTPSTLIPSTSTPSTLEPSPSTLTPSTSTPSTFTPSTLIPSTNIPSIISPIGCLYKVPNCEKCSSQGISLEFDVTQYNISCTQKSNNNWVYTITPKFSNTTVVSQDFTLNKTSVSFEGDFLQSNNSTLSVEFSEENKNGAISVSGCVTLMGKINLVLNERPQKGSISFVLITYNCPTPINLQRDLLRDVQTYQKDKFVVTTTYKNNKCDQIASTLMNQQNTLSVSITTNVNGNCPGISGGVIAAIVACAIVGVVAIMAIAALIIYKTNRNWDQRMTAISLDAYTEKTKKEKKSTINMI